MNTFRFNNWVAFNISPKYFFSGVESFGGVGFSSYINLLDNLQLIPEINTSIKNDSDFNSTLALRYSHSSENQLIYIILMLQAFRILDNFLKIRNIDLVLSLIFYIKEAKNLVFPEGVCS